jgi:hypothetical protein
VRAEVGAADWSEANIRAAMQLFKDGEAPVLELSRALTSVQRKFVHIEAWRMGMTSESVGKEGLGLRLNVRRADDAPKRPPAQAGRASPKPSQEPRPRQILARGLELGRQAAAFPVADTRAQRPLEQALEHFAEAARRGEARAHFFASQAHVQLGQLAKARDAYDDVLRLPAGSYPSQREECRTARVHAVLTTFNMLSAVVVGPDGVQGSRSD